MPYNVWGISLHRESDRGDLSHGDSFNKQAGGEVRVCDELREGELMICYL